MALTANSCSIAGATLQALRRPCSTKSRSGAQELGGGAARGYSLVPCSSKVGFTAPGESGMRSEQSPVFLASVFGRFSRQAIVFF